MANLRFTCRVVAYDSTTRLRKVLYEDDDLAIEITADLHERSWELMAVDLFQKNWELPIDWAERWLDQLVYVSRDPFSDTPQDLFAKLAYVYEVQKNGRGEPRRVRFSVREKPVSILKLFWIHGGRTDPYGTELEGGDIQDLKQGVCSYSLLLLKQRLFIQVTNEKTALSHEMLNLRILVAN